MSKLITLKCGKCGETQVFSVGAKADLTTLHDAAARVTDPKESDRVLDIVMSLSERLSDKELMLFSMNQADGLTNINYEACAAAAGMETGHLFEPQVVTPAMEKVLGPQVQTAIANSGIKWAEAMQSKGVVAFTAIYQCPKTKKLINGMFLKISYVEGKKEVNYVLNNKCEECGAPLVLLNDDHCGFCCEGLPTTGKCGCGGTMAVERVTFNK